jgi:ATP-binding cassette, subfamily B, bacterial
MTTHAAIPDDRRIVRRGFAVLAMAIRIQPLPFAVAVVGGVLYAAATVGSAIVFGWVTDVLVLPALERGEVGAAALAAGCGAIVGVALLKAAGIVIRRVGATYMQLRLHAIFRERVTRQYQRLPIAWHRRHPTGELLSNANADVEAAFMPIAPLPFSVAVVVMLALTAGVLLATDLWLALVGFVVGPALLVLNWAYNRRIAGPATRAQQYRADVSAVAHESFDGALVVKTLGRETAETERFQGESERLRDELIVLGRIRGLFDPLIEALPTIGLLLVLLVGAMRVAGGMLTAGEVVRIAYLFTLLAFPIRVLGFLLSDLPRSVAGWERVRAVLDASAELDYGPDAAEVRDAAAAADLVAVSFRYEDAPSDAPAVLRDVTFAAPPGRTIAIVGPTGSGKSTIASLLVRLSDPAEGAVRLDGRDLRGLARGAVSRHAAIVFQHSFLFDDSVRENITLGLPFSDAEVETAARLAQIHDFVTTLPQGYDTVVGERGATLSGGQRQRIALARALVRRPRLLILDDATSSVDPRVEQAILRGLQEAELPSTIIVVAYRQATIALADEIVFVQQGTIRARGTHDELMDVEPSYARLVRAYDREASR